MFQIFVLGYWYVSKVPMEKNAVHYAFIKSYLSTLFSLKEISHRDSLVFSCWSQRTDLEDLQSW